MRLADSLSLFAGSQRKMDQMLRFHFEKTYQDRWAAVFRRQP